MIFKRCVSAEKEEKGKNLHVLEMSKPVPPPCAVRGGVFQNTKLVEMPEEVIVLSAEICASFIALN